MVHRNIDDTIINKFHQGRGCGFSFDFENYDNDHNMLSDNEIIDL